VRLCGDLTAQPHVLCGPVRHHCISHQEDTRKEERVKEEDTCSPFTFSLPSTPARSSRNQEPGGERRDLGVVGGVSGTVIIRFHLMSGGN
jgi:hypothetical protein